MAQKLTQCFLQPKNGKKNAHSCWVSTLVINLRENILRLIRSLFDLWVGLIKPAFFTVDFPFRIPQFSTTASSNAVVKPLSFAGYLNGFPVFWTCDYCRCLSNTKYLSPYSSVLALTARSSHSYVAVSCETWYEFFGKESSLLLLVAWWNNARKTLWSLDIQINVPSHHNVVFTVLYLGFPLPRQLCALKSANVPS